MILPAMGIVCEVIANNTRKPIWGYKSLVYAVLAIGFLSFIVWSASRMYHLTGMGTKISTFFQATTMIISIPSVIILTCFFMSLWGGSIRFNTPMLFALAFLPMFGMGGLTGLPLGFNVSDVHLHDTYYIIAHFHYVVAPGTIFALFAGVYYWYPKMTGRFMNEFWGRVHFWTSLVFMNLIFQPMFAQGMAGMLRRMSDGGANYSAAVNSRAGADVIGGLSPFIMGLHTGILWAAMCLGLAQIPFIINVFWSIKHGQKVKNDNHWDAQQRSNGRRPRRRRMAILSRKYMSIAVLTNTACPAMQPISRLKMNGQTPRPRRKLQSRTKYFSWKSLTP